MPFYSRLVRWLVPITVLAMVSSPVLGARPRGPKIEAPGELTVMSLTNGATIEIDGKVVGVVPLEDSLVLLPGKHTIRLTKRGHTEYREEFEVKPGQSVELEIDLLPYAGSVKITTPEPGAVVKVDGKVEGTTPFDKDIPAGKKVITISATGHYDELRELDVRAGELYELDIRLRPMPVKEPEDGDEVAFYETWWFWTLIGVAGAGAATAIVVGSGGETVSPTPAFTLNVP